MAIKLGCALQVHILLLEMELNRAEIFFNRNKDCFVFKFQNEVIKKELVGVF